MGARALLLAGILAVAISAAACDGGRPATVRALPHGLTVTLPPGWQLAPASLTPHLEDPREELAAGTFPLRYRRTACAHMPGSALEDMGPRDALVVVMERGRDPGSRWAGFPARPAHFGPEPHDASEASACAPGARFTDHWLRFTDGGRHFHVLVAFGPQAGAATRAEAWGLLDDLRVDGRVQPAWLTVG